MNAIVTYKMTRNIGKVNTTINFALISNCYIACPNLQILNLRAIYRARRKFLWQSLIFRRRLIFRDLEKFNQMSLETVPSPCRGIR